MKPRTSRGKMHGSVPEQSDAALLLIDVINDLEFPEGGQLLKHALPAARRISKLKEKAARHGIPAIYVNDNFGRWRSDFRSQVDHCLKTGSRGAEIVKMLLPAKDDYFVLKPKHSGFYCSSLGLLLKFLGAKTLILTGFAGDLCVLYTANDAYMRDFTLLVPRDCVASETRQANEHALSQMEQRLKADTRSSIRRGFLSALGALYKDKKAARL